MRNTYTWKQGILKQLRPQWTNDASLSPQACCDVELGLYALLRLLPGEQANALWVLLIGYPFKLPQTTRWSEQERRMRQVLRYLLSHYKSYQGWRRAIDRYSQLPARLRLYDVQQDGSITSHADKVSIGSNRERIYGQVLSQTVPFVRDTVHLAGAPRGEGEGRSKKQAEQAAARVAWEALQDDERDEVPGQPGPPSSETGQVSVA